MQGVWPGVRSHWGKAITLLALAAALGVVWWALPVRPIASWTAPADSFVIGLSADGQSLLTVEGRQSHPVTGPIRLWNVASGTCRIITPDLHRGESVVNHLGFSPDGTLVFLVVEIPQSRQWSIQVVDTRSAEVPWQKQTAGYTRFICFSPDGSLAAFTSDDAATGKSRLVLWDVLTRSERLSIGDAREPLVFDPSGRLLAAKSESAPDSQVKVWDTATGRVLATIDDLAGSDLGMAFDSLGKTLTIVSFNHWSHFYYGYKKLEDWNNECIRISIHDATSGRELSRRDLATFSFLIPTTEGHPNRLNLIRETGRYSISFVDVATGKESGEIPAATELNRHGIHLNDGLFMYARSTPNGEFLGIAGHTAENPWLERANDWFPSLHLPSTGIQKALVLFHVPSSRTVCTISGVDWFTFAPNGRFLATYCDDDRTLAVWDLPPRKPLGWFLAIAAVVAALSAAYWCRAWRRTARAANTI